MISLLSTKSFKVIFSPFEDCFSLLIFADKFPFPFISTMHEISRKIGLGSPKANTRNMHTNPTPMHLPKHDTIASGNYHHFGDDIRYLSLQLPKFQNIFK